VFRLLGTASRRVLAFWIQWWWIDPLIGAALAVVLANSGHPGTGVDVLGELNLAARQASYVNMLQLAVIFAGFSGVGFAIYLGLGSRAVSQIKISIGTPLLRVWISALVTPWLCALALVACGITDRGGIKSFNDTRWIAIAALAIVFLQMARIVWIFYQLAATDLSASARPRAEVSREEVKVVPYRAPR
jgi:hypothetical protein